jgi:RNA polymerase sigma-54 factor
MALTQRLELRQSQALVMTPQLLQAIKLLQLSNLDLTAYVEGELERNPLLERAADGEEEGPGTPDEVPTEAANGDWSEDDRPEPDSAHEDLDGVASDIALGDADAPARSPDEGPGGYAEWARGATRESGEYNIEAFVSVETTLAGHLAEQLALAVVDPARRMIGQFLIDLVDEAGYLSGELVQVSEKLGAAPEEVEAVLKTLQGFDPAGVCARDLAECLAIQLRERNRFDPAMQALVGHLELVAKRDLAALRRICGVNDEDLADMLAELRQLNPKPGLAFGSTPVQPIVPDVFVRLGSGGAWLVELNSDTLPKVLINQSYHSEVAKVAKNDKDKCYLADCLQSATWLVRALDQRAKTILKVATEIVRQQEAFFAGGVRHLRPLNLKTIAEAIGMHESTVSRVTANKYMATERGVFELKYFFTSAIAASDGGEAHSAEAVRHHIKQLIDAETPQEILSDDAIVEKLRTGGVDIARRTVAKYREALRIGSSVQRRRDKRVRLGAMS